MKLLLIPGVLLFVIGLVLGFIMLVALVYGGDGGDDDAER